MFAAPCFVHGSVHAGARLGPCRAQLYTDRSERTRLFSRPGRARGCIGLGAKVRPGGGRHARRYSISWDSPGAAHCATSCRPAKVGICASRRAARQHEGAWRAAPCPGGGVIMMVPVTPSTLPLAVPPSAGLPPAPRELECKLRTKRPLAAAFGGPLHRPARVLARAGRPTGARPGA